MTTDTPTLEPGAQAAAHQGDAEPAATEQAAGQAATTALTVFDPIERVLADIEARHKDVVYDLATVKGNDAARKARKELVSVRTTADEVYKSWNQPILAAQEKARALRDGFKARVQLLEKPLDEMIKADEARREAEKKAREEAEAARVKAVRDRIAEIYAIPATLVGAGSTDIAVAVDVSVPMLIADKAFFQELQGEAEAAADVVLTKLGAMLTNAKAAEAAAEAQRVEAERLDRERAELDRQRAELEKARKAAEAAERARQAAAAEEARLAEEARQAAAREAEERVAAQQRELEKARAQFAREQDEARRKALDDAAQAAASQAAELNQDRREQLDAAPGADALVKRELVQTSGAVVTHYAPAAEAARLDAAPEAARAAAEAEAQATEAETTTGAEAAQGAPELTKQVDAFEAERQAAAASSQPAKAAKRPDDERLTAVVAKAFGVELVVAAEWLGTYDALEEIARIQGAAA